MDATPTHKAKILIADDSNLVRTAIRRILQPQFDVIEAENGETAWQKLRLDNNIKVLISDLVMPQLSGIELLKRIRTSTNQRIRQIPVIIATGNDDDDRLRQTALETGATDFIAKHCNPLELKARVVSLTQYEITLQALSRTSAALEQQTTSESITHLATEAFFLRRGNEELSLAIRRDGELALLRMEIDKFSSIVARCGIQTATHILQRVSKILRDKTRREDLVGHFELGKFSILLPCSEIDAAHHLATRILRALEKEVFTHDGGIVSVTGCIGITSLDHQITARFEDLLAEADERVVHASKLGGNCIISEQRKKPRPVNPPLGTTSPKHNPSTVTPIDTVAKLSALEHIQALVEAEQTELTSVLPEAIEALIPILEQYNRFEQLGIEQAIKKLREAVQEDQLQIHQ